MAKKKLAAIVKIQIPAGQATPGAAGGHRARSARHQHHGLLQGVQRRDREPARHGDPGRDLDLRGPLVHVRHQDPAHAVPAAPGRGHREGRGEPAHRQGGHRSRTRRCARSPRRRCPTSTPSTSTAPSPRWRAPPARWASRSAADAASHPPPEDLAAGTGTTEGAPIEETKRSRWRKPGRRSGVDRSDKKERSDEQARQEVRRRGAPLRPRAGVRADRGARPREGAGDPQLRRDRRGGVPPRGRPPQGRPDDPRHGVAAARHRQERAGRGVRRRRRGP